jgi:hypothetical protein
MKGKTINGIVQVRVHRLRDEPGIEVSGLVSALVSNLHDRLLLLELPLFAAPLT